MSGDTEAGTATSPTGRVVREGDAVRLEFVRRYDDAIGDVWSALTQPERVARWLGDWTGDPANGTVQLRMTAEDAATAEDVVIVACEPPILLVVDMPSPDGAWTISVALEDEEGRGGTTLRFVQQLAEPYDAESIGPGWQFYLDRLGAVVADGPIPADFDRYYPALQAAYEVPD